MPPINDNEALFISIAPFRGEQPGDISFGLGNLAQLTESSLDYQFYFISFLSIIKGELIIGNPEASSGWLSGHTDVREGIFPASYVWQVDSNQLKV